MRRTPRSSRPFALVALAAAATVSLALAGCTTSSGSDGGSDAGAGSTAPPSASASPSPGSPAGSTRPLESRILTVDQLPGEGWAVVPAATSAAPSEGAGSGSGSATVCQGDFRSLLGISGDPLTAAFERGGHGFTEQLIPSADPQAVVDGLRAAVTACFGVDTPLPGQDAGMTVTYEPLPGSDAAADGSTFGAATTVSASSGPISVPFLVATAGDAVVFTQATAPQGQIVDAAEFVTLSRTAIDAARS